MEEIHAEKVLEKIAHKLKESAIDSEQLLKSEVVDYKRIDDLIKYVQRMIEKNATDIGMKMDLSSILNELKNIRENYRYHLNAVACVKENYNTYVYVLEALHKECDKSGTSVQPVKCDFLN